MTIQRAIPDVQSEDIEATKAFYVDLLGFDLSMEVGTFLLLTSPLEPSVQLSVNETPVGVDPARFAIDVGSGEVARSIYDKAVAQGMTIAEEIDDKPWGIRRFGLIDPSGIHVSILSHV